MPKGSQGQKRPADAIGNVVHVMRNENQFAVQFVDWAKGEIGEAAERLQCKSLRKVCREKLNARISYLNQAIDRIEKRRS